MAYIIITDNDVDVKDMIDNRKAAAYLPYVGPRVEKILKNDKVFIYRTQKNSIAGTKTGIIAFGYADGKFANENSNGKENDYVRLEPFIELKTPMPFSELNVMSKKYSDKKLVFVNLTTKEISEAYADALIGEINLRYI